MADNWGDFKTWDLVLPPNRPTDRFAEVIYREALNRPRRCRVAVLGSTPELRELVYTLGFPEIVVFDRDKDFHDCVSASLSPEQRNREIFVLGDWIETIEAHPLRFDLVLSDLTSGNVRYSDRQDFYMGIARSLAPGGLFIDRSLINDFDLIPVAKLQQIYRLRPINLWTYNNFSAEFLFCSDLLRGRDTVDSTEFYLRLKESFGTDPHLTALWRGSHLVTPEGARWYYGRAAAETWRDYGLAFSKISVEDDQAHTVFSNKVRILICSTG